MGYFIKNKQLGSAPNGPHMPVGDTADRPSQEPAVGSMRYNTDVDTYEYWNGLVWVSVGIQGEVDVVVDSFTANGLQATFTMSTFVSAPERILVFIGGVYQVPVDNYTVANGFDLQFGIAPPTDNIINIIHGLASTSITDTVVQYIPPVDPSLIGGTYAPPTPVLVPGDDADGGTYAPPDTSIPGEGYDGGIYA